MPDNPRVTGKDRILYVDDDPFLLEIGKTFLESDGAYEVDTLLSAGEALDRTKSERYDAIVSDYQMPGMDGISFLKELRAQGITTPFIIFTGKGREEVVIEALNSGADFYLQKGGNPTAQFAELAHKIHHAISWQRADLALKKSEQHYRHLIEHAGEAIFVIQDEILRMVNPMAGILSGYPEQELIGQPFSRFVHPDDRAQMRDAFYRRHAGSDVPSHYTFRIVRKDGTIRWVSLNIVAITWSEHPAILNFMADVTDRKLAIDALKESEERYRSLVEYAGEAIFVTQDKVIRLVNPMAVTLSGYSEQELIGQLFSRFIHPEDAGDLVENFHKRIDGCDDLPSQYIFRIITKQGAVRWVTLSVVVITWNGRAAILNFMSDITDRKLAGDALKESEERYRQFFRTTLDGLFITTRDGRWIDFNDALVEMFGCGSRKEVFSRPIISFYANPDDRAVIVRRVEEERYIKEYPLVFRRKDGTLIDTLMTVIAVKNPDGSTRQFIGTIRDITESKRTDDALRDSEERYRQFFRTTLDGLFITTMDGRWIDFNDATVELLGYKRREEVFSRRIISIYQHPDERVAFLERVTREGYVKEYPVQLTKHDGSIMDALMTVALQRNPDGSAKALIGTLRDVTERRRTEQALKESEERYRRIFESFEDLYYQTDENGIVTVLSPSVYRLTGWTEKELVGQPVSTVYVTPEDRRHLIDTLAKKGHVRDYEVILRKRDGTVALTTLSATTICHADGSPAGVVGTLRDNTRRKEAEDALRESEEKYRIVVENAGQAMAVIQDERFAFVNPKAAEITGYSRVELTAMPAFSLMHPENQEAALALHRRRMQGLPVPDNQEIQIVHKDGSLRWLVVHSVLITWQDRPATLNFYTDITGRKQNEEALRQANRKLNLLTSITRHDIGNQLLVLRAHLAYLGRQSLGPDTTTLHIQKCADSARRIETMIQFTREYEKIGTADPAWQNLRDLVSAETRLSPASTEIIVNNVPEGIGIYADPLIAKVIYNLLDNALRHGGTVTAIRFFTEVREGDLILTCEDDGEGVPKEEKAKIFERGFGKNTGLGLALSREILAITGITITETGESGKGARFAIRVPKEAWRISAGCG